MDRTPGIRPRQSVWRLLDMASRRSFPAAAAGLGLLVLAAPLGIPGQPELQAAFVLSCVYFWSLFRPDSMPPTAVFALGLLADLLGYAPVGVSVITLLVVHGLAMRWRRVMVKQGFLVVWLAFVTIAIGAAALEWLLTSILTFRLLPLGPGALLAALAAGLYPALATMLTWAHHTLAEPERA